MSEASGNNEKAKAARRDDGEPHGVRVFAARAVNALLFLPVAGLIILYNRTAAALWWILRAALFVCAYFFLIHFPPLFPVAAVLHYIGVRRPKWFAERGRAAGALLTVCHAALLVFTAIIPVWFSMFVNWHIMLLALVVAAALHVRAARGSRKWFPPALPALAIISMTAHFMVVTNRDVNKLNRMADVLSQRGVMPILLSHTEKSPSRKPVFAERVGSIRELTLSPAGEKLLVADGGDEAVGAGVIKIDYKSFSEVKRTKQLNTYDAIFSGGKTPRDFADCEEIVHMELDERSMSLLASDSENRICKYDLIKGKPAGMVRSPLHGKENTVHVSPATGKAYFYGDFTRSSFSELDVSRMKITRSRFFPWGSGFALSVDGSKAWVNASWTGFVHEIDLKAFRTRRVFFAAPGLESIAVDEKRGRLYAGSFANGMLYEIDLKTGRKTGRVYLGGRIADIIVTKGTGRIFAASSYGLFEISPDAFDAQRN